MKAVFVEFNNYHHETLFQIALTDPSAHKKYYFAQTANNRGVDIGHALEGQKIFKAGFLDFIQCNKIVLNTVESAKPLLFLFLMLLCQKQVEIFIHNVDLICSRKTSMNFKKRLFSYLLNIAIVFVRKVYVISKSSDVKPEIKIKSEQVNMRELKRLCDIKQLDSFKNQHSIPEQYVVVVGGHNTKKRSYKKLINFCTKNEFIIVMLGSYPKEIKEDLTLSCDSKLVFVDDIGDTKFLTLAAHSVGVLDINDEYIYQDFKMSGAKWVSQLFNLKELN